LRTHSTQRRAAGIENWMKRFFFVLLSMPFFLNSAFAKLGDNEKQIDASYGKRTERLQQDDGTVNSLYEKSGIVYSVMFVHGVSVFEMYSHAKGSDLSAKEIAAFLKANAAGATWTSFNKGAAREFKRSDRKAKASYSRFVGRPTLIVMSTERR
jgi:hypothetical protein